MKDFLNRLLTTFAASKSLSDLISLLDPSLSRSEKPIFRDDSTISFSLFQTPELRKNFIQSKMKMKLYRCRVEEWAIFIFVGFHLWEFFYRTQVSLGCDLWVRFSQTD